MDTRIAVSAPVLHCQEWVVLMSVEGAALFIIFYLVMYIALEGDV